MSHRIVSEPYTERDTTPPHPFAPRSGEYPPQDRIKARNRSKLSAAIAHNAEAFAGLRAPIGRRSCQVQAPCKAHRLTWGRGAVLTWEGQPAPV